MNEQQRDDMDGSASGPTRMEWVRPEMNRLEAGAAEFGDVSSADAMPGFS